MPMVSTLKGKTESMVYLKGVDMSNEMATDKARIVAYCSHEMKNKLEQLADLRFRSLSNLIESVLAEEVKEAEASGELPVNQSQPNPPKS